MSLDDKHQRILVEYLSAHTEFLDEGARYYAEEMSNLGLPHIRMKPNIYKDGDLWFALYGESITKGVVGFGTTPAKACRAFDDVWLKGCGTDDLNRELLKKIEDR